MIWVFPLHAKSSPDKFRILIGRNANNQMIISSNDGYLLYYGSKSHRRRNVPCEAICMRFLDGSLLNRLKISITCQNKENTSHFENEPSRNLMNMASRGTFLLRWLFEPSQGTSCTIISVSHFYPAFTLEIVQLQKYLIYNSITGNIS